MKLFTTMLVCIMAFSAVIYIGDAKYAYEEPDENLRPDGANPGPDPGMAVASDGDIRDSKRLFGDSWTKSGRKICGGDKIEAAFRSACNYKRDAEDALGFLETDKRWRYPSRLNEECCGEKCNTEELHEACY